MRSAHRLGLAATLLVGIGAIGSQPGRAQDYEDAAPPPRGGYGAERALPRRAVGLNCDAVQSGLSGPQPYSCPLPGPRPLGARCFCDLPIAPLSPPQTAVGRVVP